MLRNVKGCTRLNKLKYEIQVCTYGMDTDKVDEGRYTDDNQTGNVRIT
jgi:hypothetical protein